MADIEVEDRGAVRYLRLNRPKSLNAVTPPMKAELVRAVDQAGRDGHVRCVVITGNGRAFSAGGDVGAMAEPLSLGDTVNRNITNAQIAPALARLGKPVIAAVNGLAAGSGFSLALSCDILLAADDAWFSQLFRDRGLIPDAGSTYFLIRQVGLYRAKEMVFSGRRVTAAEAHDLGLVAHVWPAAEFADRVDSYAAELAAGPTVALGLAKRMLTDAFETSLVAAIEREGMAQAIAGTTEDHKASNAAFRDGRPATFEGR